jgi:hypothetical protein
MVCRGACSKRGRRVGKRRGEEADGTREASKEYEAALAAFPRFREQPPETAFVALHADRPESAQAITLDVAGFGLATFEVEGKQGVHGTFHRFQQPLLCCLPLQQHAGKPVGTPDVTA